MTDDLSDRSGGPTPTDGDPLTAVVIDLPGTEARALGVELPAKLRRVYFDPVPGGGAPVSTDDRIRVRDEVLNVLSVQRIERGSFAGTIVNAVVING